MCRDVKGKITRNLVLDCFTLLWFPPVLVIINIFVVQIPPPPTVESDISDKMERTRSVTLGNEQPFEKVMKGMQSVSNPKCSRCLADLMGF